ncbi:prepilin-type N-terminal cleavage/methylation domain-containing protein [Pontiella sp.]|uniref:prepilin-type N-terminal cleavage/methylation domain-containing protein n=1 Tax=Pontiella sp. TaxID=2837462 RepID=UPI003561BDF4
MPGGHPAENGSLKQNRRAAFTLIEVILVVVVILIISAIALPSFSSSLKGNKLRTTARTISRMSRYARGMAIMREQKMTVVLNHETLEIYLGGDLARTNSASDGELDFQAFKNLGYTDGGSASSAQNAGIEKEVYKFLPNDLNIRKFDKEWREEDDAFQDLYLIRFFPNGQCEKFEIEIEDDRGTAIRMENDPISGKITSEFLQ